MNTQVTVAGGYQDVIIRAAQDPNFDVDKLERLVAMQEAREMRAADEQFNIALSRAEAQMSVISTDASNPQTRSKYATFARLDREIRGIYTAHGFGVSWNTEPSGDPNLQRVVGMLSNGMTARRYQIDMPIVTQGMRGQDMMTRTHAAISAVSYGKRQLLILMFNLAIGDDDDGNRAGGRRDPPPVNNARTQQSKPPATELTDPDTGEVITMPTALPMQPGDDFRSWGERFITGVRVASQSIEDIDRWVELNHDELERMDGAKPALFKTLRDAVETAKQRFLAQ